MSIIRYNNPTIGFSGFSTTRPYGDLFTYDITRRETPIQDFDANPTAKNPRRLNISTANKSSTGISYPGVFNTEYINAWNDLETLYAYSTPAGVEKYGYAATDTQAGTLYTNKTGASVGQKVGNFAVRGGLAFAGFPKLTPLSAILFDRLGNTISTYATTPISAQNNKVFGVALPYLDFRARKFAIRNLTGNADQTAGDIVNIFDRRYDGAGAGLRGSALATTIAASNLLTGPYTYFNLDTVYGWGQHDDPYAIRNDYTLRSSVAKSAASTSNIYRKALAFTESVLPFRGDRVNVIDFKKRAWQSIYQWAEPDIDLGSEKLKKLRKWSADKAKKLGVNPYGNTKDFINFFFTGPDLYKGGANEDYALVFRAILTSFSDQFSPSWSPVNMVGRADPNYQYGGVSRDIDLGFTVYATDRDELRFIYRKLNYLASFTMPTYNTGSLSVVAPWIRVTVGDLLVSQAAAINSLSYTFVDADTTWEINFEEDPEMMQVPHKIDVSMGLHLVGNQLPEKLGSVYALSKQFDRNGVPIGKDPGKNWLYDSETVKRASNNYSVDSETDKLTKERLAQISNFLKNNNLI